MSQSVRAVYNDGRLRLREDVQLTEGQEVYVEVLSEKEWIRRALGDLLVEAPEPAELEIDEAALLMEVADSFRGLPPLSEEIIAERRISP